MKKIGEIILYPIRFILHAFIVIISAIGLVFVLAGYLGEVVLKIGDAILDICEELDEKVDPYGDFKGSNDNSPY